MHKFFVDSRLIDILSQYMYEEFYSKNLQQSWHHIIHAVRKKKSEIFKSMRKHFGS